MGIGLVLLIWAVVGAVLACVGALVMGGGATYLTRKTTEDRSLAILGAVAFPFACLGWAALLFVFQASMNGAMHRDPGLGDTWETPLPNGYAILMIDETEQGWIYNPKTQTGGVTKQDDAVGCVRMVQVAGRYILGGTDSRRFDDPGKQTEDIDGYFLMDTQTGKHTNFSSRDQLRAAVAPLGISINLQRIDVVYSRYRYTWFDAAMGVLACAVPLIGLWWLARKIFRLRRTRDAIPATA